jgi:hypothetical protein
MSAFAHPFLADLKNWYAANVPPPPEPEAVLHQDSDEDILEPELPFDAAQDEPATATIPETAAAEIEATPEPASETPATAEAPEPEPQDKPESPTQP